MTLEVDCKCSGGDGSGKGNDLIIKFCASDHVWFEIKFAYIQWPMHSCLMASVPSFRFPRLSAIFFAVAGIFCRPIFTAASDERLHVASLHMWGCATISECNLCRRTPIFETFLAFLRNKHAFVRFCRQTWWFPTIFIPIGPPTLVSRSPT